MADEHKQEQEAQEPVAEEPAAEEPAGEPQPKDSVEEPAAEEAPAEEAGAEEAPAERAAAEPADDEAPEEALTPKQRRKRERSRAAGPPGSPRSASERAAERRERRRARTEARRRYRDSRRAKDGGSGRGTPPAERRPGARKERQGTVISSKPDKTITVQIEIARRHPTYEKVVRRSATVHAHDERNEANEGDTVRVVESRPLSKTKRWRLVEILERAR